MGKCDKYIRLVTSLMKTYRAYRPQTRLVKTYKELIIARRVIRWEGKYSTILELMEGKDSLWWRLFKAEQIVGDCIDESALWLTIYHSGTENKRGLIKKLEEFETNFYFFECFVFLCINLTRWLRLRRAKAKEEMSPSEQKQYRESKFKIVKYVLDVLSSYNNSSLQKYLGPLEPKFVGYITLISSCIGLYLMWT
jgi:hypothetical protein